MGLSQLPTELLYIIVSYLPRESDIYAFVTTSRPLYQGLRKLLYYFNAQYNHGSALPIAAEKSFVPQMRILLDGLKMARCKPHSLKADNKCEISDMEEKEEEEEEEGEDQRDSYWEDIHRHNLSFSGYCISAILAIQHTLAVSIQAGNITAVEMLLKFGAEVNFHCGYRAEYTGSMYHWRRRNFDNPPIFIAVQYGHLDLVNKLLEYGADTQRYVPSPLYRAVKDGRRDIISVLLEKDERSQKAVLKLAVLQNDYPMVEFLLSSGLNALKYGAAGLYAAEKNGYEDIVNLLKSRGVTTDTISERDEENWDVEDGDGTFKRRRPFFYCFLTDDPIDEESDSD